MILPHPTRKPSGAFLDFLMLNCIIQFHFLIGFSSPHFFVLSSKRKRNFWQARVEQIKVAQEFSIEFELWSVIESFNLWASTASKNWGRIYQTIHVSFTEAWHTWPRSVLFPCSLIPQSILRSSVLLDGSFWSISLSQAEGCWINEASVNFGMHPLQCYALSACLFRNACSTAFESLWKWCCHEWSNILIFE